MTTHTPGPWRVSGESEYTGALLIEGPEGSGVTVARVACFGPQSETPHAQLPNAHLVAAAPRLLAALRGMLREHDALTIATGGKPGVTDRWSERATAARAAIAAAEGKE